VFRVDPEKIPPSGIKARCARCSAVFPLSRNGLAPGQAEAAAQAAVAAAEPAARASLQSAPAQAATPAAATPAVPLPARDATAVNPRQNYGKQDPHTRANRIARALVSDIVAYHRERRDRTLAAGTLKLEFRDEIRKSWEEYVEQVGLDLARGTPFFRDALNSILANGQPVF